MITRRSLLETAGATVALAGGHAVFPGLVEAEPAVPNLPAALPQGTRSEVVMDALPGKKPLIKLTYRPPNYETPLEYFRTPLTPNDAFFVRYHLADIPEVDATKWRLTVGGEAANSEATLSLDDLKKMPAAEVVAVNQCSGNRRGLFEPHVRDGLRAMEGRAPQGHSRQGRNQERCDRDRVGRRRRTCLRQDPEVRQKRSDRQGDRGHRARRLRDERSTAPAFQRLSRTGRHSGLGQRLLDEARYFAAGRDEAV